VSELAEQSINASVPPRSLFNMGGTILLGISAGAFEPYARRVADIEGVRRVALVGAMLRDAKVEAREVPAALANASLRNPYDGRPFAWDVEDRVIVFRGLERTERGEHRIRY
jgi:hypothetical protein